MPPIIDAVPDPSDEQMEAARDVATKLIDAMAEASKEMLAGGKTAPIEATTLCLGLAQLLGTLMADLPERILKTFTPEVLQEVVKRLPGTMVLAEVRAKPTPPTEH